MAYNNEAPRPLEGAGGQTSAAGQPQGESTTVTAAAAYTRRGWCVTPIPRGKKGPTGRGWNKPGGYATTPDEVERLWRGRSSWGVGLVHAPSGTCALDVDDVEATRTVFTELGVDYDAILTGAPRLRGNPLRDKAIFKLPAGVDLGTHKLSWPPRPDDPEAKPVTVLELRTGAIQDVLPPSIHPDTRRPYEWTVAPNGALPELPGPLLDLWQHWGEMEPVLKRICPWAPAERSALDALLAQEEPRRRAAGKGADVIGKYNAAHTVEELLEAHGYVGKGGAGRYLSPSSSSGLPGVVTLDDGRIYSHHASDPLANGHGHDCFSIFCALEHGGDVNAAVKAAARELGMKYEPPARTSAPEDGGDSDASDRLTRRPILTNMADVEAEEVDWLWEPYLPLGKVALLEGHPGYGKTWLALQLTAAITTGAALPGDVAADFGVATPREPANVLFMTAEDGLADTIRPRLDAAGADPSRVVALEGWGEGEARGEINLDDLPLLRQTLDEVRPALWIIDPLFAYLGADKDLHRANEVRPTMAGLKRLAEEYHCVVLGIRHLNKGGGGSAILRGLGSIDFAAAVRSILLVVEDPQDPARRIVAHSKASLARKGESLCFRLDDGAFRWDGTSPLTADDLLAPQGSRGDGESALDEAKDFLREVLKDGPKEAKEVQRQAKSAAIATITLKRAKADLGVETLRPKKVGAPWTWALPGEAAAEEIIATDSMKKWERAWWNGGAEVRDGVPYLAETALKAKLREDGHGYVAEVVDPLLKAGMIDATAEGWVLTDKEAAGDLIAKKGDDPSPREDHPLEDRMILTDDTAATPHVRLNDPHGKINDLQSGAERLTPAPSREDHSSPLGDDPHVGDASAATTEPAKNSGNDDFDPMVGGAPPAPAEPTTADLYRDLIGDDDPPPPVTEKEWL